MNVGGRFITFEGMDGSGKSTQLERVAEYLSAQAIPIVKTREPGGTKIGQDIRALLTEERDAPLSVFSEALLIFAARQAHVHSIIKPSLDAGSWVLCDRFIDSTYAYQFFDTGLDIELFAHLCKISVGSIIPNRTYIFDVDPTVAEDRRLKRQTNFGDEDPAEAYRNYDRIRQGFRDAYANDKARCILLDADLDENEICSAIFSDLEALYKIDSTPKNRG
ncbi:MAG: dTMP kinase [Magnetovibrio sp.]|nr:dTMP kinase [Magnetovibrio sp.]|tara:strand:- start:940 stop:1599 length:660 start_codon:yes stop_codon:yes gene_type:complete